MSDKPDNGGRITAIEIAARRIEMQDLDELRQETFMPLEVLEAPPDCTWCGEPTYREDNGHIRYSCHCWDGALE